MSLRRSPVLTFRALYARRLNSLKSTGPRTARGKARSCLNALRHGQRSDRRTFRDKLVRTGDSEALYLFDFIFEQILADSKCPDELRWHRLRSLAVRAWCIESGRRGRKVAKTCLRTKLESGVRIYRYAEKFVVPRRLKIANKAGWGFMLVNPTPSRRRRVASGWIPEVQPLEGKLPKARRVRGGCKPGTEILPYEGGRASGDEPESGKRPGARQSRWGTLFKAAGRIGSSILRRFSHHPLFPSSESRGDLNPEPPSWDQEGPGVVGSSNHHPLFPSSRRRGDQTPPRRPPPPEDFWDDPEDYESESVEELLLRHKFLTKLALKAAERAARKASGRKEAS